MYPVSILGSGYYVPETVMPNHVLEKRFDFEEGFIKQSTGIKERRWVTSRDGNVIDMAIAAATRAVENAGVKVINQVIVCRDTILTKRARSIGLPIIRNLALRGIQTEGAFVTDFCNYCPGFIHALHAAELAVRHDGLKNVLVVASTDYSDMVDFEMNAQTAQEMRDQIREYSLSSDHYFQAPRLNAFLWGCGAGAVVVGRSDSDRIFHYRARGSHTIDHDAYGLGMNTSGNGFASLDGKKIYRFAVEEVPAFLEWYFEGFNSHSLHDIDFIIPHQPNPRILGELVKRLDISPEKMLVSCDTFGNMIAASIPITLHLNVASGTITSGDKILLCSFGDSYLTVAAEMIEIL